MSFNKTGVIDFGTINELTSAIRMKTKRLNDGSYWGRIHWLDLSKKMQYYQSLAEVAECDKENRFSLMGYVDAFKSAQLLPNNYTRVEYIQCTGNQAIDTGYAWQSEVVEIVCDGMQVSSTGGSQSLFGNEEVCDSSGNRYFSIVPHGGNGSWNFYFGARTGVGGFAPGVGERFIMTCKTTADKTFKVYSHRINRAHASTPENESLVINETYTGSVCAGLNCYKSSTVSRNVGNMFIFSNFNSAKGASENPIQFASGFRLYGFKMYDKGVLVRDFVPCRITNNININGLYDIIEGKFYPSYNNASFTIGGDIAGGAYEFMLTYPSLGDQYERWRQTSSPNTADNTWTHYEPIHRDFFGEWGAGPITKYGDQNTAAYVCNKRTDWWGPIGQFTNYSNKIPAVGHTEELSTELWVRLDTLSQASSQQIISPNFYTTLGQENMARVMKYDELQSAEFIEI